MIVGTNCPSNQIQNEKLLYLMNKTTRKMQDVYSIFQSLTSAEWCAFKKYLTCFTTYNPENLKQVQLAEMLVQAKECPDANTCCLKLYGNNKDHNFAELKSSLKEKTLDFLLTNISCDKQKELDAADYAIIKIKKKSAQFQQLYYSKKRTPFLFDLLDEIINSAKEYEQYSILVEHLRLKKALVSWKKGQDKFDKISKDMEDAWVCSEALNKAEHYYYELIMLGEYNAKSDDKKVVSFFEKAIVALGGYYTRTKSPYVKYYLKFIELGFYWHYHNYLKARSVRMELINIVRDNKFVYRRQRVGVVYDHLSRCDFYLGNFKQAAEWAREAQKYFNAGSENYCIALEQEFYSLFAMKEYSKAIEIANQMISSASKKELGAFRYAKYNYLLANALFKQCMFSDVLHLLSQRFEISKDKAGWEIGLRVLKIMTLIESLKLHEASMAVLALKRILAYTDKKTPVSKRDKTILALLCQAERVGFMFTLLNGNTEKNIKALTENNEQSWEPFTHEVIPFHEWFTGKMKIKAKSKTNSRHPIVIQ